MDSSEMAEYGVDNSPYFCLWNTASNNSSRPMVEHLGGPMQVAGPWSGFLMKDKRGIFPSNACDHG